MDEQPQEVMQPIVAKKIPTILIVLICVLSSGAVFGAAGYFGANYLLAGDQQVISAQINQLTKEKTDLQAKLDEATKTIADKTDAMSQPKSPTLRILYKSEGLFNVEEKKMLTDKVITAYVDYYSAEIGVNDPAQAIIISKVGSTFPTYTFQVVHATAFVSFSFNADKKENAYAYPDWYPACKFTDCRDIPQKFAEKYPNLIIQAKSDLPMGAGLNTNQVDSNNSAQ